MKTRKLKNPEEYDKSAMYKLECTVDIPVEEQQDNGTRDLVMVHFSLQREESGYFSKEYLPVGIRKDGVPKPDITAIAEKREEKKAKWYIYDIKDSVSYAKVALGLCNQWHNGIKHISGQYLDELDGFEVGHSLGVISRWWDKGPLQKELEECRKKLEEAKLNKDILLTKKLGNKDVNKYRHRIKAIRYLLDDQYEYIDDIMGHTSYYPINHILLRTDDKIIYKADLYVALQAESEESDARDS